MLQKKIEMQIDIKTSCNIKSYTHENLHANAVFKKLAVAYMIVIV